jgi:hypothetical protein
MYRSLPQHAPLRLWADGWIHKHERGKTEGENKDKRNNQQNTAIETLMFSFEFHNLIPPAPLLMDTNTRLPSIKHYES